jgi:hypothetical protein
LVCMDSVDLDVLFLGIGLGGKSLEVIFMLTTNHVMPTDIVCIFSPCMHYFIQLVCSLCFYSLPKY